MATGACPLLHPLSTTELQLFFFFFFCLCACVCVCVLPCKYACSHVENLHDGRIWAQVRACVCPSDSRMIKLLHSNELWLSVWQLLFLQQRLPLAQYKEINGIITHAGEKNNHKGHQRPIVLDSIITAKVVLMQEEN